MDPELRFVCKLCDKKYPCGKSLGSHMRSHVIAASNSAESEEFLEPISMKKVTPLIVGRNLKREFATATATAAAAGVNNNEVGGPSGYGLRENPKKTWRAVGSNFPSPQERVCKQCGKGFQSLKALCGHMACHSEKERVLKDDHSWTSENPKLVMDSHSDTEAEDLRHQTRFKSKRYKRIVVKSSHFILGNNNNNNNNNGSSSVSEIDEQEQEEIAMCLMMLSRDSGNWGGVNSVVESSDNNSVVLETKSSSIDMKIGRKGGLSFGGETLEIKKLGGARKLKSSAFDAESVQFENSYSGYLRNEVKKVESDISVDELLRYGGGYKKQPKGHGGAGVEVSDAELSKGFNMGKSYETGLSKVLTKEKGFGEVGSSSKSVKCDSRKRNRDGSDSPEFRKESIKKMIYDSSDGELRKNVHKRSKYECLNCNKTFNSHQALGGHRPCHRKTSATFASRYKSGENSLEDDDTTPDSLTTGKLGECFSNKKHFSSNAEKKVKSKKSKGHECPFCFRMFKSGQALGGHKRSHFINGSQDFSSRTDPVVNQEAADIHDLIDLNLPASEEHEADENNQFIY